MNRKAFLWGRRAARRPGSSGSALRRAGAVAVCRSTDAGRDRPAPLRLPRGLPGRRRYAPALPQAGAAGARGRGLARIDAPGGSGGTLLLQACWRYKDEYEVARLYRRRRLSCSQLGRDASSGDLRPELPPRAAAGLARPGARTAGRAGCASAPWLVPVLQGPGPGAAAGAAAGSTPSVLALAGGLDRQLLADYEADLDLLDQQRRSDAAARSNLAELARPKCAASARCGRRRPPRRRSSNAREAARGCAGGIKSRACPSTPLRRLALQGAAVILVLSLAWPYFGWQAAAMPWLETSVAIGGVAFAASPRCRASPGGGASIHAGFMPLVWATHRLAIDPGWFLLAFLLLLLVYRGALSGQVPLYLSNRQTVAALDRLIEQENAERFLDLGAGLGSTLIPLADAWPERQFSGVENAPATWLASRLLGVGRAQPGAALGRPVAGPAGRPGCRLCLPLASPDGAQLWAKAQAEMTPGSLLVSNSFPVPGVEPSVLIDVEPHAARPLYCCYRM
ncbi:MAG: hypothetical protein MZW92_00565 [Comamonadaceae bacterium]|nr:hypothetical protein [Comamonadaceae bacterium]